MINETTRKRVERLEHTHDTASKIDAARRVYDAAFTTGRIERKYAVQCFKLAALLGFVDRGNYFECVEPLHTDKPTETEQTRP